MTVGQALERAEELRPGSRVSVHTRQEWLREADGMLRERFFKASDTDAFGTVGADRAWDDGLQDEDVLLAPAASVIYPENVPANAPLLDEDAYLDQLSAAVQAAGGRFVDVRGTRTDHKGEYLYYRTDHHWTSLGAYYAYQQLCTALGLTPFDTTAHTALTADRFYGTHYSKARTWNAVPDTITWYDLPNQLTIYNVTAAGQPTDGTDTGLYDTDKLTVYDKYAMFLHGNNGLSRVQGDGTGRILVIKDSYANCFVPYLTANYADIDVVDFRNYNFGLDQLIADNDYDQILVLYSFDSFKSDPYLYRAGVTG